MDHRQLIGDLNYIGVMTCPDIAYIVSRLASFLNCCCTDGTLFRGDLCPPLPERHTHNATCPQWRRHGSALWILRP
ncbi:hypothetical protein BC827DRAFT_1241820 [Russula dissimulans]|nr:hypothetical protein BC827DRAFT_1241820 [Russula dissimulans]